MSVLSQPHPVAGLFLSLVFVRAALISLVWTPYPTRPS
jgi:hypothetical protein